MRKSTLAGLLFLCGSTAALAHVASLPTAPQSTDNSMTMNNMMSNDITPDPLPKNEMTPAPMPTPSPTPGVTTNELSSKPM